MKTTVKSNSALKTIAAAAVVLLIAGNPVNSFAKSLKEKHKKSAYNISESQMDVQYIGSDKNTFNFIVKFKNSAAQKFTLIVKNDEGEVIYSKEFNDVYFSKTIRLVKDENDTFGIHPTFAVSEGSGSIQRSFSIER